MIIHVYHAENPGSDLIDYVACVDAPMDDIDQALNYAFRWTNNVDGSWSKDRTFQLSNGEIIHDNGDYNERVNFVGTPHPKGYGARSTSVGDWFVIDHNWFEVMPNGFRKIEVAA